MVSDAAGRRAAASFDVPQPADSPQAAATTAAARRARITTSSLGPRQHAAGAGVAPFLLQVVAVAVDQLVVLAGTGGAQAGPEVPGALVAVLVASVVVPGVAQRVGDRLVVLVAGHVDRVVGGVVVGVLPRAAGGGDVGRVRLVGVQREAAAAAKRAVVGAVVAVGAARAVATAHVARGEQEVDGPGASRPALRGHHPVDLGAQLRVAQADRGVRVPAAVRRVRVGVEHRAAERRVGA